LLVTNCPRSTAYAISGTVNKTGIARVT